MQILSLNRELNGVLESFDSVVQRPVYLHREQSVQLTTSVCASGANTVISNHLENIGQSYTAMSPDQGRRTMRKPTPLMLVLGRMLERAAARHRAGATKTLPPRMIVRVPFVRPVGLV